MATDTIRFSTNGQAAVGTFTADVYPAGSLTAHSTGLTVTVSAVAGIYTVPVVTPTAGTVYRLILRDSGLSPTHAGEGWFVAKNDGSTIDELTPENCNAVAWNALPTVALPLVPTTPGRALDVSAGGEAGIDWANVGSPTVTNALTGTTVGLTSAAVQGIWDALTSALTTAGSIGKKLADWVIGVTQTGDSYTRLGTPSGSSIADDIAAISTGSGSGGNSIAVTVSDSVSSDPIQTATVTLERTGETAHDTTDVDGIGTLGVTTATFQLIVTAAGYVGYSSPLVVSASASVPISLTPIVVGATDPGQTTGSITVYDLAGAVVSGATVTLRLISLADGTVGVGITPSVRTATTNGSGIATFDGLPRLARYTLSVDGGATSSSGVTADAPTTNLISVIGPTA